MGRRRLVGNGLDGTSPRAAREVTYSLSPFPPLSRRTASLGSLGIKFIQLPSMFHVKHEKQQIHRAYIAILKAGQYNRMQNEAEGA